MHDMAGAHHPPAEGLADALMAEADAQDRSPAGEAAHDLQRDAGALRRAGSGRDDDMARRQLLDLAEGEGVVAQHRHAAPELAHVARQVMGEGIVVVDQEHAHDAAPVLGPFKTSIMALALVRLSSYSAAGSESATIPPPTWKVSWRPRMQMVRMTMLVSIAPSKPI